jgi:hypothetical protein
MIQAFVAKKLIDVALKKIMKAREIKNLRKYVEEDNELDVQMKQVQKKIDLQGKYIEELEKDVAILKTNSHPEKEFVRCENCQCKIKEK